MSSHPTSRSPELAPALFQRLPDVLPLRSFRPIWDDGEGCRDVFREFGPLREETKRREGGVSERVGTEVWEDKEVGRGRDDGH